MQKSSTPSRSTRTKADPRELEMIRQLRKLLRNPTAPHRLRYFLSELNDVVTTALIREGLDRIERERAQQLTASDGTA
jgi:hypothetical protein